MRLRSRIYAATLFFFCHMNCVLLIIYKIPKRCMSNRLLTVHLCHIVVKIEHDTTEGKNRCVDTKSS